MHCKSFGLPEPTAWMTLGEEHADEGGQGENTRTLQDPGLLDLGSHQRNKEKLGFSLI